MHSRFDIMHCYSDSSSSSSSNSSGTCTWLRMDYKEQRVGGCFRILVHTNLPKMMSQYKALAQVPSHINTHLTNVIDENVQSSSKFVHNSVVVGT